MSRLREWCLWRAPVGEPWAETAAIALWMSLRHGRCLVAIPGGHSYSKVSLWRFILLPPHHPPTHPPTPIPCWPYINVHLKKNHLKSTENRPPAINKVSYMKVSRLLCLLLPIQDDQLLVVGCLNWQNILKWYCLKYYQVRK